MTTYLVDGKTVNAGEAIEVVKQPGVETQTIAFSGVPTLGAGQTVKLYWRVYVNGRTVFREAVLSLVDGLYVYNITNEMEQHVGATISAQLYAMFGNSGWTSAPFIVSILPETHITTLPEVVAEVHAARGASASLSAQLTALLATKANKAASPTAGHIATVDANGHVTDGGTALAALTAALTALKETPIVSVAESKTLALTDAGTVQKVTGETATTITIPLDEDVTFAVGSQLTILSYTEADVAVAIAEGGVIQSVGGNKKISAQYGAATLKKLAADTWVLYGSLKA